MGDVESQNDEPTHDGNINAHQTKLTPSFQNVALFSLMCFRTLGIIYGDIGTSPLYVLNGIFGNVQAPSVEDTVGAISAIVWSLTLVPLVKYSLIVLRFGTEQGEGGPFALYIRIANQCGFSPRGLNEGIDLKLVNYESGNVGEIVVDTNKRSKWVANSPFFQYFLSVISCLGAALTMSDGLLTPAVSVVSAVEGMAIAKPELVNKIVPISFAILTFLFFIQRYGTASISLYFSPIVALWVLSLLVTGIVNVTSYPKIFRALDPSRAVMFFVRTKDFDALGGVLLAITGVEGLFADLIYFSRASISVTFGCFMYPCLVIAYLGQGARIVVDQNDVIGNVFYQTIPGGSAVYWLIFVLAVLSTIIASQAMISATFSLLRQAIAMKLFPPFRGRHTSKKSFGHLYYDIPGWMMYIAVIALVAGFGTSQNLTNAYGFAVATVMVTTTILVTVSMVCIERYPVIVCLLFASIALFIDCLFWGATLKKVPQGAWFPLGLGMLLMLLMQFWKWAKNLEDKSDMRERIKLSRLLISESEKTRLIDLKKKEAIKLSPVTNTTLIDNFTSGCTSDVIEEQSAEEEYEEEFKQPQAFRDFFVNQPPFYHKISRVPGLAIYQANSGGYGVPLAFAKFIKHCAALHEVNVFLVTRIVTDPFVAEDDRLLLRRVPNYEGFYQCVYSVGYMERPDYTRKGLADSLINIIREEEEEEEEEESSAMWKVMIQDADSSITFFTGNITLCAQSDYSGMFGRLNILKWLRDFSINEVYNRMIAIFGDGYESNIDKNTIIHIGVELNI